VNAKKALLFWPTVFHKNKKAGLYHHAVCLCVYVLFQFLKQLIGFHKIWYEHCIIGGHPNRVIFMPYINNNSMAEAITNMATVRKFEVISDNLNVGRIYT
jgi:hypothetical protein